MASSGSGPWELKPVCAGRQRRMGTAMSTADAFDGDREDEPSLLPPQVMPVYRRPGGGNVTGEHLQRAYEAAQREDERQAEGELGYGAVPRTPPPRNVSLWAKRRGAAPPPEALADDLEQQMVIEDGGWRTSQAAEGEPCALWICTTPPHSQRLAGRAPHHALKVVDEERPGARDAPTRTYNGQHNGPQNLGN